MEQLEDRRLLATVVTDKLDYAPAETALISATDFQRGESVKFQVLHIDGTANTGNGHEPWTVTDGGIGDLDGKRDGNISTNWYVDPDDSLGATFELSALGLSSGLFDTHIFTDAAPPSNGNLFQWDPPGWVTGNNDGPYVEGDTVPYYTDFNNLIVGDTYSITIEWDTTKSGKHAIDYLRSYDATISFPPAVDPAVQAGINVVTTDFFPIPEDTFMTGHPTFSGVQQPGEFKMYNGDIIAVSPYNTPLTYLGDTSTSITLTFVAQDDGDADPTTTSAVLTWGGHIATRQDWGLLNSAVDIPGSPYHMRLDAFFDVTNQEVLGLGNTDRSLSADAVIFPAIITIIKDAVPDDAQDFAFTTTGTGLANFTLDDDGDNSNTLSNSQQFSVTIFDAKTITEVLVPGWALTNIQISEIGGTDDSTFDIGNRLATLGVQEGEIITVVFTNTLQFGSIAWEKRDEAGNFVGGATFEISPDPTDGVGVMTVVDNGANDADPVAGQILVNNVPVGSYTVTETISPAGYALDDDVTRAVTVSAGALNQVIGIQGQDDPGNTDESDFHNRLGSIAWEKRDEAGNFVGGATFEINLDPLDGVGTLVVGDNGANDADPDAGQILVLNARLGTYTITETISPSGYALDDDATRIVTISSSDLNAVVGTQGQDDAGNTDESDFHNRLGSMAWEKRNEAGAFVGGATFEISPDPLDGVGILTVVDNGANDADPDPGQIVVLNARLGTYTITETISPAGYALDDDATRLITVSSGDLNAVVGIQGQDDAGNTDESDFHNRLGSLAWEKRNEAGAFVGGATFEISPDPLDGVGILVVVDNGANDADPDAGQILVQSVLLGTYTITETVSPSGYALDDDATRLITVSSGDLNAVVGTQGQDDAGNTDDSDFHNRLGSIAWEKRDEAGNFVGGATFEISPDPLDGVGILTVVDNGLNDADPDAGQILVVNARLGSYTVTETVSPAGYALDDDTTRLVTVSSGDLNAVIGTQGQDDAGNTDESDFHNLLGSIAWEKRDEAGNFVGGATFEVSPDPLDGVGTLTVVDNGANDADPDPGQILVLNARLGTYTITETISPAGYALDDDATRLITVSSGDLNAVVGTQGQDDAGNTDESDFHNRIGSIAWEKRNEAGAFVGGATFEISPDPLDAVGILTVVDNGANDADPDPGQILVLNARLGTYTITETVSPAGYALDDDATRLVTVSSGDLNAVVGTQGQDDAGNTDESDFHNRLGSIAWEKRDEAGNFVVGATFEISPDPVDGVGILTVVDNGLNDADPDAGQILVLNVLLGTYTITETISPPGYALDDDATRVVTVSSGDLNAVVGTQGQDDPGNTDESDFHNRRGLIAWEKRDEAGNFVGGATFVISPDPLDGIGTLTVVDNGLNDADPDPGQIQVNDVLVGSYTVTETVSPAGYALDDDTTRLVTITEGALTAIIGTQGQDDPGNTDESDFHNRLGSIAWEKRDEAGNFVGGATFQISPDPLDGVGTLTVVDNGAGDADADPGQILLLNARLGTYTITETVSPTGYALDDDATRIVTVSDTELNVVVGTQGQDDPGNTDESDFHNRLGSIAWEKRDEAGNFVGGATFEISLDPLDGVGTLVVVDNGAGDADPDAGQILVINARLGTYTITETISPAGYALDDDATRLVTVSSGDLNAVVGTQGQDDAGNTDESDFHNRLGTLAWEKRNEAGAFVGGATFEISPDPLDGVGVLVVVDNGANDADPDPGQILVSNVRLGTYTITETISPAGYALDDDATRLVTVSSGDLNAVVGTQGQDDAGNTDESDFHNRQGSIEWEKRDELNNLQGGATFTVTPDPTDGIGSLIVVDNGPFDGDLDPGQFQVTNVPLGTYTVTETVPPANYLIDDDADRVVTVSAADLNAVIGVQGQDDPGNTDESDFHNIPVPSTKLGTKFEDHNGNGIRDAEDQGLPGWTIFVDYNDNGAFDGNEPSGITDASGNYTITGINPGTWKVREVLQPGWVATFPQSIDAFGRFHQHTFTPGSVFPGNDFGNFQLFSISGQKFGDVNQNGIKELNEPRLAGWTIQLDIGADGTVDATTVTDALGNYSFTNLGPGIYRVREVQQAGWTQTTVNPTDIVGASGTNVTDIDFGNFRPGIIVIGPDKSPTAPAPVLVLDQATGEVKTSFLAYESTFVGGTRVTTGDMTGDGIDEIITAPGRGRVPEVRVFTQDGVELTQFRTMAYPTTFKGGVQVAVGDVNGDGLNDIVTARSSGNAIIRVFLGQNNVDPIANSHFKQFNAFGTKFVGGAFVRVADMGTKVGTTFNNTLDGKAEIIVGSGPGIKAAIKVFHVNATPVAVRTINPFTVGTSVYKNGVNFDVADLNGDDVPDLVVGSENGGNSRVETFVWNGSAQLVKTGTFMAFGDSPSKIAPVRVAAIDSNGDGVANQIAAVQGPNGTTQEVRIFDIVTINPLSVTQSATLASFPGPYFIADLGGVASSEQTAEAEGEAFEPIMLASPTVGAAAGLDVNGDGKVSISDALLVVNRLNQQASTDGTYAGDELFDVNGDGRLSALDAMMIVNELNRTVSSVAQAPVPSEEESERYAADVDELFASL